MSSARLGIRLFYVVASSERDFRRSPTSYQAASNFEMNDLNKSRLGVFHDERQVSIDPYDLFVFAV
jgi:hypothetical protein